MRGIMKGKDSMRFVIQRVSHASVEVEQQRDSR